MARPKEFDVEEALEKAMNLFWQKGYEGTSMSELVEHVGVSRQSLYDTFGDKHAIFTAALNRGRSSTGGYMCNALQADEPIRQTLRRIFFGAIEMDLSGDCARGCLMVNATVELANSDPEIRKVLCENAQNVESALTKRFAKAQEDGEIGAHHNPVALARFYSSTLSGLRVTSKIVRDRAALEDVVRVALAVLG